MPEVQGLEMTREGALSFVGDPVAPLRDSVS
jgi:hypothetical protein